MSTHTDTDPAIRYLAVTFDCPDPAELARFYGEALGLPVTLSTDGFVLLGREGSPGLGFYRVEDYQPPAGRTPPYRSRLTSNWAWRIWIPPRPGSSRWEPSKRRCNRFPSGGESCWTRRDTLSASFCEATLSFRRRRPRALGVRVPSFAGAVSTRRRLSCAD